MLFWTLRQNHKGEDGSLTWKLVPLVSTTKLHLGEPYEPEEEEHLFHSQMWVKGTPLHFIVDSGSQKNLISA
jgi:hypothetical protein